MPPRTTFVAVPTIPVNLTTEELDEDNLLLRINYRGEVVDRTPRGQSLRYLIPAKPLLDYVEAHGGIYDNVSGLEVPVSADSDDAWGEPKNDRRTYDREKVEIDLISRSKTRIERAAKRSWINLFEADELCVEVFGVHPTLVYPNWFELEPLDLSADDTEPNVIALPLPEATRVLEVAA